MYDKHPIIIEVSRQKRKKRERKGKGKVKGVLKKDWKNKRRKGRSWKKKKKYVLQFLSISCDIFEGHVMKTKERLKATKGEKGSHGLKKREKKACPSIPNFLSTSCDIFEGNVLKTIGVIFNGVALLENCDSGMKYRVWLYWLQSLE